MRFINRNAAIVVGCFIFALVLVAPAVIHSDEWNLSTRFTINHPFEVPGMVLQPNTRYVIRLYDSPAERHVVQIFNGDQTKLLTTFMAVSDQRAEPADNTVFTFIETEPGYPLPMKEWFYPGRITGLEFIYPKQQAMEIARHANEPIQAASASDLHDLASVEVEAIQPLGKETPVATSAANITKVENAPAAEEKPTAPSVATEPAPTVQEQESKSTSTVEQNQAVEQAQNESQPTVTNETEVQQEKPAETSVTTEQTQNEEPTELPRTAGELPLVGLIGMLCLGAGLGMKVLSSKS
jgi:hypothetical protein